MNNLDERHAELLQIDRERLGVVRVVSKCHDVQLVFIGEFFDVLDDEVVIVSEIGFATGDGYESVALP